MSPTLSWKRATGLSFLALYGPFLVMALYMLAFVSCSHCKESAWKLLAFAPGMLPVDLGRRLLDLPRLHDTVWFTAAVFASAGLVYGLAWLLRRRAWVRFTSGGLALALFSWFALAMYSLIRS